MEPSIPQLPPGASRKRNVFDVIEALKQSGAGKNILVRVDFNVPMNKEKVITDDSRIRGALPTIRAIINANMNAILMSHMGRPKLVQKGENNEETNQEREKLSLQPIAEHLGKLMDTNILFAEDCINAGETVKELPAAGGGICLLNNLRFYKDEEKCGEDFVATLASYGDAYVNDAFGTAHRPHASVSGVPSKFPKELCGIGCLVASELAFLDFSSRGENEKVAAIIGGSKVSTKLPVIQGLLQSVDMLVLGGGLAFTFLKAQGIKVGSSLVEDGMVDTAKELLASAEKDGKTIILPLDAICAKEFPQGPMNKADTTTFQLSKDDGIEDGYMGLDVGEKTIELYRASLSTCSKIVMNGPAGVFEIKPFDEGTRGLVGVLEDATKNGTITVVGGGDSVAALEAFGKIEAVSYVSTGGGATLELLAGDILPGVAAIADYE